MGNEVPWWLQLIGQRNDSNVGVSLDDTPEGVVDNGDMEDAQEEEPWHLQLVNQLKQTNAYISRDINEYVKLVEELGVFNTTTGAVVATQGTTYNMEIMSVLVSFDTSITSYILTLGEKVIRFNSNGTCGEKYWQEPHWQLSPGDNRSLVAVTGTPAFGSLIIVGKQIRTY